MQKDELTEAAEIARFLAASSRPILETASTWEVASIALETCFKAFQEAARREGHLVPRFQLKPNPPVYRRGDL